MPANYRLVPEDIEYIFDFAEVDFIIADKEFEPLLSAFRKTHPNVNVLVDLVSLEPFLLFSTSDFCSCGNSKTITPSFYVMGGGAHK